MTSSEIYVIFKMVRLTLEQRIFMVKKIFESKCATDVQRKFNGMVRIHPRIPGLAYSQAPRVIMQLLTTESLNMMCYYPTYYRQLNEIALFILTVYYLIGARRSYVNKITQC